jgi:sensor histidine kinase YesM
VIKQLFIEEYKGSWKRAFNEWVTIPLICSLIICAFINWGEIQNGDYDEYVRNAIISFMFWSLLSNGNALLICYQDKHWTWLEHPMKRLVISIAVMLTYSVGISLVVLFVVITGYYNADFFAVMEHNGYWSQLKLPLMITTFFMLTGHGKAFLLEWRQSAIDVERLKSENLKSKFESLKSQVNPHFLFNSLNALSSLVYSDQDKAADFIQKLSEVYRYVLDHQHDEVVSLAEELAFVKSYVYLNQIRFGKNLRVNFEDMDDQQGHWVIPPVAIQMLVENALKHNEVSTEHQLNIHLSFGDQSLIVRNNLNPILEAKRDASGVGLSNVTDRFKMMTSRSVKIVKSETEFIVEVPLLKLES